MRIALARFLAPFLALPLLAGPRPGEAAAPSPDAIRIGVLSDMTGPYADLAGAGSVIAAQMAAEDFAAEVGAGGPKVEILAADQLNKPDVGAAIVRAWIDRDNVAAVVDVPNSAVALAVNQVLREKDRVFLASSPATSDLTGRQCSPDTVQWVFDTWALAHGTARAVLAKGGQSWFFITADYAFGQALERDASAEVKRAGGALRGDARVPLNTHDFSSYLLQAQNSGADVVALANAGADAVNAAKQAAEFGLTRSGKQRLVGLLLFLTDIDALGLADAQGLLLTEAFYWDLNDKTRAWSQRFAARHGGRMPTMDQAGVYSSVLAYLRATRAAHSIVGHEVVARMKQAPIDDPLFGPTTIRADGRAVHAMYLFQVKSPAESKGRWDDYNLVATIPAAEAFRPLAEGGCSLVP